MNKRILIVSAHADDESFGMGGALNRFKLEGHELHWLILSKLWEPKWDSEQIKIRDREIKKISASIGFSSTTQWDFPDNAMDKHSLDEYQSRMIPFMNELLPSDIFCPGPWDWNTEHRLAYQIVEMTTKAIFSPNLKRIYSYEIPSSTEWKLANGQCFEPNYFINIEGFLEAKATLFKIYESENHSFPHSRSEEYIKALSKIRGAQAGIKAAEAFYLHREIL